MKHGQPPENETAFVKRTQATRQQREVKSALLRSDRGDDDRLDDSHLRGRHRHRRLIQQWCHQHLSHHGDRLGRCQLPRELGRVGAEREVFRVVLDVRS